MPVRSATRLRKPPWIRKSPWLRQVLTAPTHTHPIGSRKRIPLYFLSFQLFPPEFMCLVFMLQEPQDLEGAASAGSSSATVVQMRSAEGASDHEEENPNASEDQEMDEPFFTDPMDEKVAILVYFLLYKYQKKEPVTKVEMIKTITRSYKSNYSEILRRAAEILELLFGLDVKEIDTQKHIYMLINKLEISCDSRMSEEKGVPKTGLLMTVLGVIFTKGNRASEDQIWERLNMIGLYKGREHFLFGEPSKLITFDLVQEKYLEYRQVPGSDPPCHEFLWGPRAYIETSKMKVLEYMAKVGDMDPSAFPLLYEEALKDEEERAKARVEARAHAAAAAAQKHSKAIVQSVRKYV